MNTGWRKQERTSWEAVREGCRKFDLWKPYLYSVHQDSLWGDWCTHTHRLNTFPGRSRGVSIRASPSGRLHQAGAMGKASPGEPLGVEPLTGWLVWTFHHRLQLSNHLPDKPLCLSWQTFDFLSLQKKSKICFPKTLSTALLLWFWWILSISKGSGTRNLRKKILWRKSFGWTRYCL